MRGKVKEALKAFAGLIFIELINGGGFYIDLHYMCGFVNEKMVTYN